MGTKRKTTKGRNLRFGKGSTYGQKYEFKGVRYWIYKREGYDHYTTKIKIKGEKEIRRSLDRRDLEECKDKVKEMILEYQFKLQSGQNLRSRPFKVVSQEYLKELKGNRRVIDSKLKKYKSVITLYLNEFFGDMKMESITEKVIYDYRKWRDDYWKNKCKKNDTYTYKRDGKKVVSKRGFLKKPVSLSTLHKEDVVLRKVIEYGRLSGDISKSNVIEIKSQPFVSKRRPSFTKDEWDEVLDRSKYRSSKDRLWENNKGKKGKTDCINQNTYNQRVLLHDYISFMVGSGLRTTESIKLKWNDLIPHDFIQEINGKYKKVKGIKIYVEGKDKERKVDPQPYCKDILERIKKRQEKFSKINGFKFMGKEEYVFSDDHGNRVKSFSKSFTHLLDDCGLLKDPKGNKRVIGSLRHTYGSLRKNLGEVDVYELSRNMGTSVKMIEKFYLDHDDYDRSSTITRIKKKK